MATADAASVADGLGAWGLGSARGQHIGVLHVRRDIEVMSGLAVFGVRALLFPILLPHAGGQKSCAREVRMTSQVRV